MDMSIVIRCDDDERVFQCVDSVGEDVEIVVSTSGGPEFLERLSSAGITYCQTPRGNLSIVSNLGFARTRHDRVLITDSDTTFGKGCVREMYHALDAHKVARSRIVFRRSGAQPFSGIIAEARDYVNSLPLIYTPGIAVRKDILPDIGGFLFNEPVPYAVDADLNYRIKRAKLAVGYPRKAVLYHDAESLWHDARAAHRIGRGCMISAISLSAHCRSDGKRPRDIARELKGVKPSQLKNVLSTKGPSVFCYQIFWDSLFYAGMTREYLKATFFGGTGVE